MTRPEITTKKKQTQRNQEDPLVRMTKDINEMVWRKNSSPEVYDALMDERERLVKKLKVAGYGVE